MKPKENIWSEYAESRFVFFLLLKQIIAEIIVSSEIIVYTLSISRRLLIRHRVIHSKKAPKKATNQTFKPEACQQLTINN